MSNMSYCRFENTLGDLRDCKGALDDMRDVAVRLEELSEVKARFQVLEDLDRDMTEAEDREYDFLYEEYHFLYRQIEEHILSDHEKSAKESLLKLCAEITEEYGDEEECNG